MSQKYLVDNFPYAPLSAMQYAIFDKIMKSDMYTAAITRRAGKSWSATAAFMKKIDNEGGNGKRYLAMITKPSSMSTLIHSIFPAPFGKEEDVTDLNHVYIKMSGKKEGDFGYKWIASQMEKWKKDPKLLNLWLDNEWLHVTSKNGVKTTYIKLFISPLRVRSSAKTPLPENANLQDTRSDGRNKNSIYTAMFFNGSTLICAPATKQSIGSFLGGSLDGVYGEEVFAWDYDKAVSVVEPMVIPRGGFTIYVGTPNHDNAKNWAYKEMVHPLLEDNKIIPTREAGLDIYEKKIKTEWDVIEDGVVAKKHGETHKVLALGDFEDVFPFMYNGSKTFADVQSRRKFVHRVEEVKDEEGNVVLLEDQPKYIDNHGAEQTIRHYKYRIVKTKERGTGNMSEAQYNKEYRVSFDDNTSNVFYNYKAHINVISSQDFTPSNYRSILGYDSGTGTVKSIEKDDESRSSTAYVKVAFVPYNDTYQFVVYEEGYLKPDNIFSAKIFYDNILNGIPVIAENALWRTSRSGKEIEAIYKSYDKLRYSPLANLGVGMHKCVKPRQDKRISRFNDWLGQYNVYAGTEDIKNSAKFRHPTFPEIQSAKMVFTDNCPILISIFSSWSLTSGQGGIKYQDIRDDLLDSLTYAIQTFIYEDDVNFRIKRFWSSTKLTQISGRRYNNGSPFTVNLNGQPSTDHYTISLGI